MIFNSLKWRGLFSYGDYYTELYLNKEGTTFVRGVNKDTNTSNGSGKSSILDILVWTLYGSPLKDIPKDKVTNNHSKKGGHSSIDFYIGEDHYKIDRYRKHKKFGNSVKVEKNGEPIEDGTNRDAQKRIDQILGLDYQSFISSFTFTSEITFEFPMLTPDRRRSFLEQILGLKAYSEYGKIAKQQVKVLRSDLENIENILGEKKKFLTREKSDYVSYTNKHENFDTEKQSIIDDLKVQLENVETEINNCEPELKANLIERQKTLKESLDITKEEIHEYELKLAKLDSEVKELITEKSLIQRNFDSQKKALEKDYNRVVTDLKNKIKIMEHACPTCGRDWDMSEVESLTLEYSEKIKEATASFSEEVVNVGNKAEKQQHSLQEKIDEIESNITKIKSNLDEKKKSLKETNLQIEDITEKIVKLPSEEDLYALTSKREKIISDIKRKSEETSPYTEVLKNLREKIIYQLDEIDSITEKKKITEEELKYYTFWDESFNTDGLKMFIFESIIPVLNSRVAHYMPVLNDGRDINLQFDKFLNMDIVKDGTEIPYGGLSKGERKRVDLAIALSLLETAQAQHGITSNVMFFDEIFDSSLDSEGVKTVTEILQTMPFSSIFVISHRLEISAEFDNTIDVVKEGKFSKILSS